MENRTGEHISDLSRWQSGFQLLITSCKLLRSIQLTKYCALSNRSISVCYFLGLYTWYYSGFRGQVGFSTFTGLGYFYSVSESLNTFC